MANLLASARVRNPLTHRSLSEAMCFGLAGGLGAGYSYCPSLVRHGQGSGISVVGRYRALATGADFCRGALERLGAKVTIQETGGAATGFKQLVEGLAHGQPVLVYCAPLADTHLGWAGTYGMYVTLVERIDLHNDVAYVGDCAPDTFAIPLDELAQFRSRVNSHKFRSLRIDAPSKLSESTLKTALISGIRACADDFARPTLQTYGLPGLTEWAKVITNTKSQRGWPRMYKGGLIYLALRDMFDSIETAGTGGGLYRTLYADFLDEAADQARRPAWRSCAEHYRELANRWTELAEAALPSKFKLFKETKQLLRKRRELWLAKGPKAAKQLVEVAARLKTIETELREKFPLGDEERLAHLESLRTRILALHASEVEAAARLYKSAG
ncbi:MAG: DUF4872 domain-containing protein [Pirellulales bacterium]|nr:DUF4872 domain-containing protein [Pirellulales bacterium]